MGRHPKPWTAADIKLIGCAVGLIEKANALSAEQNQGNAILN
jgi:hypothetical protein